MTYPEGKLGSLEGKRLPGNPTLMTSPHEPHTVVSSRETVLPLASRSPVEWNLTVSFRVTSKTVA